MTDWESEFIRLGAIWIHGGESEQPHALLTSGKHSDGFVNCTMVTQRPTFLRRILVAEGGLEAALPKQRVDWVIGSAYGAITIAHSVAERLETRSGFTQKNDDEMKLSRFTIKDGESVLVVEDVISTGGSTLKTIKAIEEAAEGRVEILPFILCLVNRSGKKTLANREIKALITPEINIWGPEECPLCAKGSKAVRPKDHWQDLVGTP